MEHRIAHLDMDAFYASVELLRRPHLRGLPLVIGGRRASVASAHEEDLPRLRDYVGRGVATTATYEARALGVHSGMGLMKAAALAPDAILLPADFAEYARCSRLFKLAVAAIAPQIEDRGIDEIYIDLSDVPGETRVLAQRIKDSVRAATGLSCSIGVSPNKLLAKIASDLEKPDGLTLLAAADVAQRVWPLPVRKINGIGPKAEARLAALEIRTVGDLARAGVEMLQTHFGANYGAWLHSAAAGIDERPVVTRAEPKSISRETTFDRDLHPRHDRAALSALFTALCRRVAEDLQRKGYRGRCIGVKLRYSDFHTVTRDCTLAEPSSDPEVIRRAAAQCLRRVPLDQRLRLLGVRVGALSAPSAHSAIAPSPQQELPLSPSAS